VANSYYDNSDTGNRFLSGETARGEDVDAKFDAVETAFDQVGSDIDRALKMPSGSVELPSLASDRAGKLIGFDQLGNLFMYSGAGAWRGDYAAGVDYKLNDSFRDPSSNNLYSVLNNFTSSSIAADLANGDIELSVNFSTLVAQAQASSSGFKAYYLGVHLTEPTEGVGGIPLEAGMLFHLDDGVSTKLILHTFDGLSWQPNITEMSTLRSAGDLGAVGGVAGNETVTCDLSVATVFQADLSAASTSGTLTFDFTNLPDTSDKVVAFDLQLKRGGRKALAFTCHGKTLRWSGNAAPVLSTSTLYHDVLSFHVLDDGSLKAAHSWAGLA